MATNALYRKSSGEVIKISPKGQTWPDIDATFWGVLVDPSFPDGTEFRHPSGLLRVLDYAKFADVGGNTVRNATQQEIDTFEAAQVDDENQQDAAGAGVLFETHPRFRKLMTAYSSILKDEFNLVRSWTRDFKAAVDAATSLADLKVSVAALPDLEDRTLAQLKTAIANRISKDD
jgi:hypothetical protein